MLKDLHVGRVRPVAQFAHGIGKSALTAFVVLWLMATRPHSRGTVTANTYIQLETKTWAAIQKWQGLCVTAPWFICTTKRLYYKGAKETWFCSPATCKEENSEAFAGQHAADASSFYVFDEASAVPDKIFEVAEGGLTDGHPMIFLYGNPLRQELRIRCAASHAESVSQQGESHVAVDERRVGFAAGTVPGQKCAEIGRMVPRPTCKSAARPRPTTATPWR
jgi:hypothetical protein